MKLSVFRESKLFRTDDQSRCSTGSTAQRESLRYKRRKPHPAFQPSKPNLPNAPTACSMLPQASIVEVKPVVGIERAVPWGLFAAFAAALASTGVLFVMALTGGIYLG